MIHWSHLPAIRHVPRAPRLPPTQSTHSKDSVTCRGDTPPDRNTAPTNLQADSHRGGAIRQIWPMRTPVTLGLYVVTTSNKNALTWSMPERMFY
jgi:hypothetical protein